MEIFETHDAILKEIQEPNFDFNYYSVHECIASPEEDLTCPICQQLFNVPIVLPKCGHMFCKGCLDKWLLQYSCPICRQGFGQAASKTVEEIKSTLIDINTMFLIDNLPFKCKDCEWRGKLKDFQHHQHLGCAKCKDCDQVVEDLEKHQGLYCKKRMIYCPLQCGQMFQAQFFALHLDGCEFMLKECKKCNNVIQGQIFDFHSCQKEIYCENKYLGCKEINDHQCQFATRLCQKCYKITQEKHDCKQVSLSNLLKSFKQLIIQQESQVEPTLKNQELNRQICSQQSIIIDNCPYEFEIENLIDIASNFGPILNIKEYMNLKQKQEKDVTKKVVIRFSHENFKLGFTQYFKNYYPQLNLKQPYTKQSLEGCLIKIDNLSISNKNQIVKAYECQDAELSSQTKDLKTGKILYHYILKFETKDKAQNFIKKYPQYQLYLPPKPKYNLDPYK